MIKIAIIGGGASGLACAATLNDSNIKVHVFEKLEQCGKKILASGNGRCNISNVEMNENYYNTNHNLIKRVLDEFDVKDFFESKGLVLFNQGPLIYPFSNQSKTVQQVLIHACSNVNFIHEKVSKIENINNNYYVTFNNQTLEFDYIVLAMGSSASVLSKGGSYNIIEDLNLKLTPRNPSLVQFITHKTYKKLQGVRSKANVSLVVDGVIKHTRTGEVQFTNYGLSGICIMQLSRYYHQYSDNKISIKVDLLPGVNNKKDFINNRIKLFGDQYIDGLFNDKLVGVIKENNIDILNWNFSIKSVNDELNAQVISGGLCLSELTEEFELHKYKNMFATGELLDVDGDCGGYNLHFAFGSGFLVANSIKRRIGC